VRAQIQGQIISINSTEGQTVHAGDCSRRSIRVPIRLDRPVHWKHSNATKPSHYMPRPIYSLNPIGEKGWATPQFVETRKRSGELQRLSKADQALIDSRRGTHLHAPNVRSMAWSGFVQIDVVTSSARNCERPRPCHAAHPISLIFISGDPI